MAAAICCWRTGCVVGSDWRCSSALREPQRFELADLLGIDGRLRAAAPPALCFPLVDLFLDARFGVDQAFSGITHRQFWLSVQ